LKASRRSTPPKWRKVMGCHTLGVFLCCRACTPHMRARRLWTHHSTLASGAPRRAVPLFLPTSPAKGAVIAMTRGLARELAKTASPSIHSARFTLSENVSKWSQHTRQGEKTRLTAPSNRDETPEDLVGTVSFSR